MLKDLTIEDYSKIMKFTENSNSKSSSTNVLLGKIKGKEVHKGEGKYGPFIQIGRGANNIKPKFISLKSHFKGQKIEIFSVSLNLWSFRKSFSNKSPRCHAKENERNIPTTYN